MKLWAAAITAQLIKVNHGSVDSVCSVTDVLVVEAVSLADAEIITLRHAREKWPADEGYVRHGATLTEVYPEWVAPDGRTVTIQDDDLFGRLLDHVGPAEKFESLQAVVEGLLTDRLF